MPSFTRQAMRRVSTRVLPEPAAANTHKGRASVVMASRCCGSQPASKRPAMSLDRALLDSMHRP